MWNMMKKGRWDEMAIIAKAPSKYIGSGWCPGCGHGIFTRLIHEVLEEKGLSENNVCLNGVGCSANYHNSVTGGNQVDCHHGRATATAIGMKSILPDTCIWTYQGDGDAYAIGMGETILAAQQGHPICVFVVNNTNYGMTGGQAAPTTLPGQITTTTTKGNHMPTFDAIPTLLTLDSVAYLARGTTASAVEIRKLKQYISRAVDVQMKEKKFAFVEVLGQCPTNWHKTPVQASEWILENMAKSFMLGEFKS